MVSPVDINPINSSADEEAGTTVVRCENDASIQKFNGLATLEKEMETMAETRSIHMILETPKLLSGIEDSHHGPSDAMHNPPQALKVSQKTIVSFLTKITLISIDFLTPSELELKMWQFAPASGY
ncbi:hypothetical protein Tco_0088216 [Tanacetum coccineum]